MSIRREAAGSENMPLQAMAGTLSIDLVGRVEALALARKPIRTSKLCQSGISVVSKKQTVATPEHLIEQSSQRGLPGPDCPCPRITESYQGYEFNEFDL